MYKEWLQKRTSIDEEEQEVKDYWIWWEFQDDVPEDALDEAWDYRVKTENPLWYAEWNQFKSKMADGDELWTFSGAYTPDDP